MLTTIDSSRNMTSRRNIVFNINCHFQFFVLVPVWSCPLSVALRYCNPLFCYFEIGRQGRICNTSIGPTLAASDTHIPFPSQTNFNLDVSFSSVCSKGEKWKFPRSYSTAHMVPVHLIFHISHLRSGLISFEAPPSCSCWNTQSGSRASECGVPNLEKSLELRVGHALA